MADNCPRPEACVIAHECRVCRADRGEPCRPYAAPDPVAGIAALAREIAERETGMPAYLVDDEQWESAWAEAQATYQPPEPPPPLAEAVRKAQGKNPTAEEIEESIGFLNRVSAAIRKAL